MLPVNVNPANQGFPRAPDGGTIVPSSVNTLPPNQQAFAPAPLVNPFPIEPTAPLSPVLPANAGQPVLPANVVPTPPFLAVDVAADQLIGVDVPSIVVTDQGSYQTTAANSAVSYVIASVVDNDTGLPPDLSTTTNLLITLVPGGTPLTGYGVSLAGRIVQIAVVPTSASRTISANGAGDITVPNAGFIPVVGDTALVAGQYYSVTAVVDAATLLPPTPSSLNLKVSLYGATFVVNALIGQTAQFTVTIVSAERQILIYSDFALVIPLADAQGTDFLPVVGDTLSVDTGRYDSEIVVQNTGTGSQNVIPRTQPLPQGFTAPAGSFPIYLPELGEASSGLPVPDFVTNDQVLAAGTPVNVTPGIDESNPSSQQQAVVSSQATNVYGQPITVYPGAQNRN